MLLRRYAHSLLTIRKLSPIGNRNTAFWSTNPDAVNDDNGIDNDNDDDDDDGVDDDDDDVDAQSVCCVEVGCARPYNDCTVSRKYHDDK